MLLLQQVTDQVCGDPELGAGHAKPQYCGGRWSGSRLADIRDNLIARDGEAEGRIADEVENLQISLAGARHTSRR
ncbi:hypothetical protein [Amycolatopsis lurida]|uniref:hypothetical protein n=1 Tax=Amycolatopsis lurida TaxID=31959 RepID=UPI003668A7B6